MNSPYYNGLGVEQNYSKAVEWYTKSAEQGNARAQYNLGYCYYNGLGVEKNRSKAVELFAKSVEQGNVDARNNLKISFEHEDLTTSSKSPNVSPSVHAIICTNVLLLNNISQKICDS